MRILINTVCFYPGIGGIETMNMILCKAFESHGHKVVVIAPEYPSKEYDDSNYSFTVLRNPSSWDIFKEYIKCDIFFHSQISLKAIWPILIFPLKKWVCSHHMCEFDLGTKSRIVPKLKYLFSRFAHNIVVSNTVARYLNLPSAKVIYNAYNNTLFKDLNKPQRTGFVFVGRLMPAKGCALLLDAFYKFYQNNPNNQHRKLTFIGSGPEEALLKTMSEKYGINEYVEFCGNMTGETLVNKINDHLCQVVPSTYHEAFGIVALESMACGCITITSDGDGLVEATGECGFDFKKNDANDLTQKMETVVSLTKEEISTIKAKGQARCRMFTPDKVATRYEEYLVQL